MDVAIILIRRKQDGIGITMGKSWSEEEISADEIYFAIKIQ